MHDRTLVFIGCGITLESGGLCVTTTREMEYWHGGGAGAASVVAIFQLLVHLHLLFQM
jgi:leucyl aminopeptidase